MKILGLDRCELMVRDIDKALDFFGGKLGMEFSELDPEISKRDGVHSYVCNETHLHLVSPRLPLSPNAPPVLKKQSALLEKQKAFLLALTFLVDDLDEVQQELEKNGYEVLFKYNLTNDYRTVGLNNFEEIVTKADSTLDITIGFAKYDISKGNIMQIEQDQNALNIKGLDRVIFMVKDMDKALRLFSDTLGLEFRETSRKTQKKTYNRSCISLDHHLHLVQPFHPMPDSAPVPLQEAAKLVENCEGVLMLVIFKVDDSIQEKEKLKDMGYFVLNSWENNNEYVEAGMKNIYEYLFNTYEEIGLPVIISQWEKSEANILSRILRKFK